MTVYIVATINTVSRNASPLIPNLFSTASCCLFWNYLGRKIQAFKLLYRTLSIYLSISLSVYGSTAVMDLGRFFSFLIYTQSVGLRGRGTSPSQGLYLHTEQHKHNINADTHSCIEWDSNPLSHFSRGRRWIMPQTARPL
jgi:hypothetical protein